MAAKRLEMNVNRPTVFRPNGEAPSSLPAFTATFFLHPSPFFAGQCHFKTTNPISTHATASPDLHRDLSNPSELDFLW